MNNLNILFSREFCIVFGNHVPTLAVQTTTSFSQGALRALCLCAHQQFHVQIKDSFDYAFRKQDYGR